jgi:hypothetical protein
VSEQVRQVLSTHGYVPEDAQLAGHPVLVGRRKDFRVRWMLTQLKTSVLVGSTGHLTPEVWQAFLAEGFQLAAAFKGGLPNGLQSAVGMVAVLACDTVDPAAAALAEQPAPRSWFTGIGVAAALDRSSGAVHTHDGRVVMGRVYIPFLRAQRDLVVGALPSEGPTR